MMVPSNADPVILRPLNAISDHIGGVENGLVDVPASALREPALGLGHSPRWDGRTNFSSEGPWR